MISRYYDLNFLTVRYAHIPPAAARIKPIIVSITCGFPIRLCQIKNITIAAIIPIIFAILINYFQIY